ncbi:MltR family transcriptional regulator [Anatilimnocola floriformis]|uniref:MltR family transcriptional regulator n=1 Tax=Anatilimnocola floriformis TaxID=2948575 RepID=UPI0036F39BB1
MSLPSEFDRDQDNSIFPLIVGKDLDRHFNLEMALVEFSRLFAQESNDRAMVIVGASFLDTQLEHIVRNFLVDDEKEVDALLQYDQPLGSYGNRIRTLYCLGLIGKMVRDDLRLVGKIRNRFAHDLIASFDEEPIKGWARSLQWHRKTYMEPPAGAAPRELFNVGVNRLVGHLSGIVSVARSARRSMRREV